MCKLKSSRLVRKRKKRDRKKYNKSRTSKGAYTVALLKGHSSYDDTRMYTVVMMYHLYVYLAGDYVLANNKALFMSPVQLHCIGQRMTLPIASSGESYHIHFQTAVLCHVFTDTMTLLTQQNLRSLKVGRHIFRVCTYVQSMQQQYILECNHDAFTIDHVATEVYVH